MPASKLFAPALAPMLARRSVALVISVVAIIQAALVWMGWPAWPCPFAHAFGVACPGCGLSRATIALLRGDWRNALALHAFAPCLLCALILFGCAALLPTRPRAALVATVTAIEQRTGLTILLLIGLVCYWLARLAVAPNTFARILAN